MQTQTITNFATNVDEEYYPDPENNVFNDLYQQYEQVIFKSIITAFGLDMLIKDRLGGDVDTINNVRQGEAGGGYKNAQNAQDYDNRGEYNYYEYHDGNQSYRDKKHNERENAKDNGGVAEDNYTGKDNLAFSKSAPAKNKASIDHTISAKSVHDDPGRVLAELDGADLANSDENLAVTNQSLNSSMGAESIPEYIEKHPELAAETKRRMMEAYEQSKKALDKKINYAYYTSSKFWKNTGTAAFKVSGQMALRQVLGFIMTEVWFCVKKALKRAGENFEAKLRAIGKGIKRGFENAKRKYRQLLAQFKDGAISGLLSSLTTTLCNIFFTTAKNFVRIIRQTWAALVEATQILLFNPDNLPFSQRMRAALKILAAAASVVIGTIAQEAVRNALTPYIGALPILGDSLLTIISIFAGSLCTGFLTVTLLYLIDNNPFKDFITASLNKTISDYKQQTEELKRYAAMLQDLTPEDLEHEISLYKEAALSLENAKSDEDMNNVLVVIAKKLGIKSQWGECTFDAFMRDKSAVLQFSA